MNSILEWFASKWWTTIDGLIIVATLCFVIRNFTQNRKQSRLENEEIDIIFEVDGIDYKLDFDIPRKQISRSEIQGIISAFQNIPSQRYIIDHLSKIAFLEDIFKIQNNEKNRLEIVLTSEEFNGGYQVGNNETHKGFSVGKMKKQ